MLRRLKFMNEKGIAMILVLCMIGLLSVISLCLLLDSGSAVRVTSSMERRESVFQAAEAGLRLALYGLVTMAPSPGYNNLTAAQTGPPTPINDPTMPNFVTTSTPIPIGSTNVSTQPSINFIGVSSVPPAGYMLNAQGDTSFFTTYYQAVGTGTIAMPGGVNNSTSVVSELVGRVSR